MKRTNSILGLIAALSFVAAFPGSARAGEAPTAIGPDVTVIYISTTTSKFGPVGDVYAYSIGTTSCNVGGAEVAWCDSPGGCNGVLEFNDHPVIAQNLYRLKDDRFEQIGMSWLKHGFVSTNSFDTNCRDASNNTCQVPPFLGNQLGMGCTDTYSSSLNAGGGSTCAGGVNCRLGPRSEVNAVSGEYPMPYANEPHPQSIDQRIQVVDADIDPALNAGALYWAEGQYVTADDAVAERGLNNASYRAATFDASRNLIMSGASSSTVREKSAVYAWRVADAAVEIKNVDLPSAPVERFEVGRRVTSVDVDTWHHEYVIRNMNSDRSARAFSINFPDGTSLTNVGFKDIEHHSGEPYATTDWTSAVDIPTATISWSTETFVTNPNANALRWATMFNFWFDADQPSGAAPHTITFFKPGSPASVTFVIDLFSDGFESGGTTRWSETVF